MNRIALRILPIATAIIFILSAVIWPLSYFRGLSFISRTQLLQEVSGDVERGYGYFYWAAVVSSSPPETLPSPLFWYGFPSDTRRPYWSAPHRLFFAPAEYSGPPKPSSPRLRCYFLPGFEFQISTADGDNAYFVVFPVWVILIASGLPLGFKLRRHLKRRWRLSHGLCIACGYDLRHSKDKCPECGTVAQT